MDKAAPTVAGGRTCRCLIVEDNPFPAYVMTLFFEEAVCAACLA